MKLTVTFYASWGLMSVNLLTESIPFSSNVQVVIDKIAEILVYELANQQTLATDADDYDIRVYTDRFQPLDQFKNDKRSLVNIELSDASMQTGVTATYGKQQESVTINLYIYSVGTSIETDTGHRPADYDASVKVKKTRNVINRILKADINSNLQLDRSIVNSVVIQAGQYLVPDFDNHDFGPVVAMRVSVQCNIIEQPVVNNGVPFDQIQIDILKDDTGLVYASLLYEKNGLTAMQGYNDTYDELSQDYTETVDDMFIWQDGMYEMGVYNPAYDALSQDYSETVSVTFKLEE